MAFQALSLARAPTSRRLVPSSLTIRRHGAIQKLTWSPSARLYSESATKKVEPPDYLSEEERKVFGMIKDGLNPTKLEVQDISGGCGSMYALDIVSEQFKGLPVIKQHRLVNKVLEDEINNWHGIQLKTKAP